MPYIKPKAEPFEPVARLLKGYDLNAPALATVLGCSAPTARRKLSEPATLTLADLDRINRFGHVPLSELREALRQWK